ncbi:expressed unknown protein [Ectocarpus siliculosus]|uniref:Uncharacterized protein n=1 Tax=Ectocarpus siliculosus TaxID=2880 RepID=D7G7K3_ECTSI|nr:expressed unknown protein [Ectocarpus siliculosus]|eukprot:CBJ27742.1 expressed unknown protein [Ectocarpus siliculosus]
MDDITKTPYKIMPMPMKAVTTVQDSPPCCCARPCFGPPARMEGDIKAAHGASIAILAIHAIALLIGCYVWGDWTTVLIINLDANLTGVFTSIFVLWAPSKFVYVSCAILYGVTGLLDMILVAAWFNYEYIDANAGILTLLAMPNIIASFSCFLGCAWALKVFHNRDRDSDPRLPEASDLFLSRSSELPCLRCSPSSYLPRRR